MLPPQTQIPPETPEDLLTHKAFEDKQRWEQARKTVGRLDSIGAAMRDPENLRLMERAEEAIKRAAQQAGEFLAEEIVAAMADTAAEAGYELRTCVKKTAHRAVIEERLAERAGDWIAADARRQGCPWLRDLPLDHIAARIKEEIERIAADPAPGD